MGRTVGTLLICYDVNREQTPVKNAMKALGYNDNWRIGQGTTHHLPDTTLWHSSKSSDAAISDLQTVCANLGARIERATAVLASEFAGI